MIVNSSTETRCLPSQVDIVQKNVNLKKIIYLKEGNF